MDQNRRSSGLRASGLVLLLAAACGAEVPVRATVDFRQHVREWDGFGVNYVETAQTRNCQSFEAYRT